MFGGMQAIQRGTWLAVQGQLVFACVVLLLAIQARAYLLGLPPSSFASTLAAAMPYAAVLVLAVAVLCQPWAIAKKKEAAGASKSGPEQQERVQEKQKEGGGEDNGQKQDAEAEGNERSEESIEQVRSCCNIRCKQFYFLQLVCACFNCRSIFSPEPCRSRAVQYCEHLKHVLL